MSRNPYPTSLERHKHADLKYEVTPAISKGQSRAT